MERPRLVATITRLLTGLELVLLPPSCAGCGRRGAWFCSHCSALLKRESGPCCQRCDAPVVSSAAKCWRCDFWPAELLRVRAPYTFDGPIRAAIHRAKYSGEHARARELGRLLATFATGEFESALRPARLVVPVPLHPARRRERGYNQAELLAAPVAEALGLVLAHSLVRQRVTPSQAGSNREARQRNVMEAFRWTGPALEGAVVLVVDDVVTTGATLAEVARTLAAAGATGVIGLALAREP